MDDGDGRHVADGQRQASETMSRDEPSVRRWWHCAECGEPVVGDRLTAGQREQPLCAGCSGALQPVTWTEWHLGDQGQRWASDVELSEELMPVSEREAERVLAQWMADQMADGRERARDEGGER